MIFIAVKPYILSDVLNDVSDFSNLEKLFVSVAAGITTKTMEKVK